MSNPSLSPRREPLINIFDRVFIAGHAGMAGSAILRTFQRLGYGGPDALCRGGSLLTAARDQVDLTDINAVKSWFSIHRPSVVVLAAAKVGGILANSTYPADFLLHNLKIQNNVIEVAWQSGVRRLLFLGSSCIYPKYAHQPIREESLLTGPLEQTNEWYAIAKIAGIKLCQALRLQHGFDAISLMPTNLYGIGDNYHPENSHVMAAMIRRFCLAKDQGHPSVTCWGSGKPRREFLHVDDLAMAVVFALEQWDPDAEMSPRDEQGYPLSLLNVGSGVDQTIFELARVVAELVNFRGSINWDLSHPDGTPQKLLDISRITNLGWKPEIGLKEGIAQTIQNFRATTLKVNLALP